MGINVRLFCNFEKIIGGMSFDTDSVCVPREYLPLTDGGVHHEGHDLIYRASGVVILVRATAFTF